MLIVYYCIFSTRNNFIIPVYYYILSNEEKLEMGN